MWKYVTTEDLFEIEKIDLDRELKLCPFCGESAIIEYFPVRKGFEAYVMCNDCGATTLTGVTYGSVSEAINEAINRWNKRTAV